MSNCCRRSGMAVGLDLTFAHAAPTELGIFFRRFSINMSLLTELNPSRTNMKYLNEVDEIPTNHLHVAAVGPPRSEPGQLERELTFILHQPPHFSIRCG